MTSITGYIQDIFRCDVQYRNAYMEPLGLSGRHARYLMEIFQQPGISQDHLTQRIGTNKSNTTRQVALLEEDGYITRVPCPKDKRVIRLYLTEKAQALLPRITAMRDAWEAHLAEALTPEEAEQIVVLLTRVREKARTWTEVKQNAED